jgi:uncharacterized delta-60 repeat protein
MNRSSRRRSAAIEALESRVLLSQAGMLDTSFSGDGQAQFAQPSGNLLITDAVAVQGDGKVVVAGTSQLGLAILGRLNADGTPDTTFGANGNGLIYQHNFFDGTTVSAYTGVAVQSDGKIVVSGYFSGPQGSQLGVARYTSDGFVDDAFGTHGQSRTNTPSPLAVHSSVLVQPDGKILVASDGTTDTVGRFLSNGALDTSIGSGGYSHWLRTTGFTIDTMTADFNGSAATNPNYAKPIVAGYKTVNGQKQFLIARLNLNGSADTSFSGGKGYKLTPFIGGFATSIATGVAVQSDGRIVVSGTVAATSSVTSSQFNIGVIRLNSNGSGDSSFGVGNGQTVFSIGTQNLTGGDLLIGQTGKLIVGGTLPNGYSAVQCLNSNGTPDNLFAGTAQNSYYLLGWFASINARLALGTGGTIVTAGGSFGVDRFFDRAPTITVKSLDPNAYEAGQDPATIMISRAERLPYATRVYFTRGGTATPSPNFVIRRPPSGDYTGISEFGILNYVDIPANFNAVTITITPRDDSASEPDENVSVSVADTGGVYDAIAPSSATITIFDNDRQIGGTVYNDMNGNGANDSDPPIAGRTVYLDLNHNKTLDTNEPSTTTDANGRYAFGGLANGTYDVREKLPSGWIQMNPAGAHTIALSGGTVVNGQDFATAQYASLSGFVFNDANNSGSFNASEKGLGGWRVYIDRNNDGKYDSGDVSTLTKSDGTWSLSSLRPGPVVVRIVVPSGWKLTQPATGSYKIYLVSGGASGSPAFGAHHG